MNMSYCRFHNTYEDLQECKEALDNADISSVAEKRKAKALVELCKKIAEFDTKYIDSIKTEDEDCEEQELLVRNKWNGKTYKVLETTDKAVTLQREDGTKFTIQKSEYFFNYFEKRVDKVN